MEDDLFQTTVEKIAKVILTNQQKMIREEDLRNLCNDSLSFDEIINRIYINLKSVGFDLITSTFLDEKFYLLTTEGKDDKITPSQYGSLALILALNKEIENIKFGDLKEIFSEIWDTDIKYLIDNDYLKIITIDDIKIVKVTPLGKALFKDLISDLQLKNLLDVFKY
ncbi:MAG: hypothetical protein P8Y97_21295 [Candidatus Lokiarchaeota archaeon]